MSLFDSYLKQINELLQKCDDIEILDFIFHLLQKRSKQEEEPDASQGVA